MRDPVAYLRNRAKDERLAGNADLDVEFGQCADEIERLRAKLEQIAAVCQDNAAPTCRHDMALDFIRRIAENNS